MTKERAASIGPREEGGVYWDSDEKVRKYYDDNGNELRRVWGELGKELGLEVRGLDPDGNPQHWITNAQFDDLFRGRWGNEHCQTSYRKVPEMDSCGRVLLDDKS